jgi:hypothetical protein
MRDDLGVVNGSYYCAYQSDSANDRKQRPHACDHSADEQRERKRRKEPGPHGHAHAKLLIGRLTIIFP